MAIREIVTYGNPILRKKNLEVKTKEEAQEIVNDLRDSIKKGDLGLAAPQIGINKKVAMIRYEEKKDQYKIYFIVNPEIYYRSTDNTWVEQEGCLSFPELYFEVERNYEIKVKFKDENFQDHDITLKEWPARIFQHEIDHLESKLFIDRISNEKMRFIKKDLDRIKALYKKDEKKDEKKKNLNIKNKSKKRKKR